MIKDIAVEEILTACDDARTVALKPGEVLFREGDPGEEMFFIRTGAILVSKKVSGRVEQILNRFEAGASFGEMSIFGDEPIRTATIQADVETTLLALDRESINDFIRDNPRDAAQFFQEMARVLIRRLVQSTELVREVTRWGLEATGLDAERKSGGPPA